MNQRNFHIEAPLVPEHFIETRERTLNLIQHGEGFGAIPSRSISRAAVVAMIAVLLLTAGAAAAVNSFGILDFLNWGYMSAPEGAEETFQTDLGKMKNEIYTASVEEAYFDGGSYMLVVRYAVNNPQEMLFVKNMSGHWDEDLYRRLMVWELSGPEDPWKKLSEYEDERGGSRTRLCAVTPEIFDDNGEPWGSACNSFQQPDGSLIFAIYGTLDQPVEGSASISVRCGVVGADEERPTEYDVLSVMLKPSETVWQAEYVPESKSEGWAVENLRITSGRMLMRAEVEYFCESGVLDEHDYGNIAIKAAGGTDISILTGGGAVNILSDGGIRGSWIMTLLAPDGCADVLHLYLERDGRLPLGPIECRMAQ